MIPARLTRRAGPPTCAYHRENSCWPPSYPACTSYPIPDRRRRPVPPTRHDPERDPTHPPREAGHSDNPRQNNPPRATDHPENQLIRHLLADLGQRRGMKCLPRIASRSRAELRFAATSRSPSASRFTRISASASGVRCSPSWTRASR